MAEFSAYQVAVLADDIYALTRLNDLKQAMAYLKNEHGDVFTFGDKDILKAKTGGPGIIKVKTAFGVTLLGQGKLKGFEKQLSVFELLVWKSNYTIHYPF